MSSINQKLYKTFNEKFFYGWVIVGIGSLGIFASGAGQSHTFSPFIPVISKDLQISSIGLVDYVPDYQTKTLGAESKGRFFPKKETGPCLAALCM